MSRSFRRRCCAFAAVIMFAGLLPVGVLHEAHAQGQGVPVQAQAVETGSVSDEIEVVGDFRADESVVIRPEIDGLIKKIQFTEGEAVSEGEPLFLLDDDILSAELADAQAALELAKRNYERSKQLFSRQVGTERTRDESLAAMQSGQAKLALARARLEKTKIKAPFSGIVGFREISVGAYVSSGTDLVRLVKMDPIEVDFRVPERFLSVLAKGQQIAARVDAFPGKTFRGEVTALDNVVDVNGRSIRVRARVPNPDGVLRPGLFARVSLRVELRKAALLIPEEAVVPTAQGEYVFRIVDGKAKRTDIRIGKRMAGKVEVIEGLSAADTVIVAGQQKVRDGAPVQPLKGPEGA